MLVAGPAHADNYDYPGSCLAVYNNTSKYFVFSLDYPAVDSGTLWTYTPGLYSTVALDGRPVRSTNGSFTLRSDTGNFSWNYDSDVNRSLGCNGSWIVTVD